MIELTPEQNKARMEEKTKLFMTGLDDFEQKMGFKLVPCMRYTPEGIFPTFALKELPAVAVPTPYTGDVA